MIMQIFWRIIFVLLSLAVSLYARGTLAGTSVVNQAQIKFVVGDVENNITSNTDEFVIDQVIDVDVSWQDSAPVEVGAGEEGHVLTFRLTNLGNGDDNITLSYEHNTSSDFNTTSATIYQDTNGNGIYDPSTDTAISHTNLSADANVTLFIVADIPTDANMSERSYDGIIATSDTNATAGADDQAAVDVVVRKGRDTDEGIYEVRDYWLASRKSVTVHSDDNQTHTGTRLTYTIDLSIGGNNAGKSIAEVKLTDTIPAGTRYIPGSLSLDGTLLTDAADSDAGSCDGNTTQVTVGTISGDNHHRVSFDVEVR